MSNALNNELWSQLYGPSNINDIYNKRFVKDVKSWIYNMNANNINTKKVLLIYGDKGVGKSVCTKLICSACKEFSFIVYDSGESRNKRFMEETLTKQMKSTTLVIDNKGINIQKPIIMLDELDSMNNLCDLGGLSELTKIIKNIDNKKQIWDSPLILVCNNIHNNKYNDIKKMCEIIEMKTLSIATLLELAENIKENKVEEDHVCKLAKLCNGDIRLFLDNLQIENTLLKQRQTLDISFEERVNTDVHLYTHVNNMVYNFEKDELFDGFYFDQTMIPSMIYENMLNYSDNPDDMELHSDICSLFSYGDVVGNQIFSHTQFQLYDLFAFATVVAPITRTRMSKMKKSIKINFPTLMTKNASFHANKKSISALYRNMYIGYTLEHFIMFRKSLLTLLLNKNIEKAISYMIHYNIHPENIISCIKVREFDTTDYKKINNIKFKKQLTDAYLLIKNK